MAGVKTKSCNKISSIGGQAVLEGVMMRGKKSMAIAVRDNDGNIQIESKKLTPPEKRSKFSRFPFIRGVVNFVQSLVVGMQITTRSAEVFGGDETEGKATKWAREKLHINVMNILTTFAIILGVVLAVALFIFLPQLLTNAIGFFCGFNYTSVWYSLIEGLIRIAIFVGYLALISLMKEIKRVYMYHGAEHKTITCYEKGLKLTVANVKTCRRVHDRCGTTFLFLVMFVSIFVMAVANIFLKDIYTGDNKTLDFLIRFGIKIVLLPIVASLSYELLKVLAKSKSPLLIPIKAPGLLLQRLTTKEPDDSMIEVAISAFKEVEKMDNDEIVIEKRFVTPYKLSELIKDTKEAFKDADIDEVDAEWLISIMLNIKRSELNNKDMTVDAEKVKAIFEKKIERLTGRPLWYVLGDTEFYGNTFKVDERALIPRPETEILVETIIRGYRQGDRILDVCTGSGAIAISLAKKIATQVTACDISADALSLAKENAELNNVSVNFIQSDMLSGIKGQFDIIVSNPPYIKSKDIKKLQKEVQFEPKIALDGGEDGLDFYRILAQTAPKHLKKYGCIIVECGIDQAQDIVRIFSKAEYTMIIKDLEGVERIVKAVY